ncbi:hypothetical protein LVJ94_09545 [Pendulispora rubella]|uniref:Uncharacterized protein n=1 Tax=Pendulispora rubella TaxID=2741070 RepID=A0ABZ2L970_9BACT
MADAFTGPKSGLVATLTLSGLVILVPACASGLDTTRVHGPRASVGEEMYGVICDRFGAQALREDLSGGSFRALCHRAVDGQFDDKVDVAKLPAMDSAVNASGQPVSLDEQRRHRDKMVGRVEALARRRSEVIRAFDAIFPETPRPTKDIDHPDPAKSCNPPEKAAQQSFAAQVGDMLGRIGALYNDGTIPQSTGSLATVIDSFQHSEEAQGAWSHISSRLGYRPVETGLGALRPILAYPELRDLSNATLRLLSADSNPYQLDPQRDEDGQRIPVPGPANTSFDKLLEAAHAELLATKADPRAPALASARDPQTGRIVLSRPRDNLEILQEALFGTDPAIAAPIPKYIVRRNGRGYASISPAAMGGFVDADGDGIPDVDARGRFITRDGALPPAPFPSVPGTKDSAARDAAGRALAGHEPFYDYLDTNSTFAARLMQDLKPLVNPDPAANHETLMDLLGGLHVTVGPRERKSKTYPSGAVSYDGIGRDSPMLDLVFALGTILGDRHADTTLGLVKELFTTKQPDIARAVGELLRVLDTAKKHDEAKIPRETTFWDDILDLLAQVAQEPGFLEDLLYAFGDDIVASNLGAMYSKFGTFRDELSYDEHDINGTTWNLTTNSKDVPRSPVDRRQPETGKNRSDLMRFLRIMSDTSGVTVCNKEGARLYAKVRIAGQEIDVTLPLSVPPGSASYRECELIKVDNLGVFYLQSVVNGQAVADRLPDPATGRPDAVKPGVLYVRDRMLRDGLIQIPIYGPLGAARVDMFELSTGIKGFWTEPESRVLAPKPKFLNRLAFFDFEGDDVNAQTRKHIDGLIGPVTGTKACQERVIEDPLPNEIDAAPDKKIRGLRTCAEGQWLQQRDANTIFLWEHFGLYDTMSVILRPFVKHRKEQLFLDLASKIYKYYPDASATAEECLMAVGQNCTRQGLDSYEALVVEILATDLVPALSRLAKGVRSVKVQRCEAYDAKGVCTSSRELSGIDAAAEMIRAMLDPEYSKKVLQLKDRHGNTGTKKNDGSPVAQVTPAYLLTNAMDAFDRAYDAHEKAHPDDAARRTNFRRARSQLADQFLSVKDGAFENPILAKLTPKLIDLLRSQLGARCPKSFAPPFEKCTWAQEELAKKVEETLGGPLFSSGLEIMDVIRKDPEARKQIELLLQYLLDGRSDNDAFASTLASAADLLQLLGDEEHLVPLYHVLASAVEKSAKDARGRIVQKSFLDAQTALLSRVSGKYVDRDGREICSKEMDPNQVVSGALRNAVTPIRDANFEGQSPIEVLIDVVADVNRVDPTQPYDGLLQKTDYTNVSAEVVDFLVNKERGLEQFYEAIRRGTSN